MQSKRETEQQSLIKKPFKFKQLVTPNIKERDYQSSNSSNNNKSMATLQRFKLLATQCGVAQSPTRSPRTSPVVHFRRRRTTLRTILLGRRSSGGLRSPPRGEKASERGGEKALAAKRNSLKDLFVSASSPPNPLELEGRGRGRGRPGNIAGELSTGRTGSRSGPGSPRPVWSGFRYRSLLLRRAWRPVLVTIPE